MKYYIEISSWNLLESFVTESISPYSFYQERNFGNNLSRYLSGDKERFDNLILSENDLGGDYSICVDERIVDKSALIPIKGLKTVYTYPKSIYYRKDYVKFRFGSFELRDALIAESVILLEVKCLEKYSSDFYVKKVDCIERKGISKLGNTMSFNKASFIDFDNSFNRIKGAVIGYVRGLYTTPDEANQLLQSELRGLKNRFGGLNTQIMMNDHFSDNGDVLAQIDYCKKQYINQIDYTNSFDVLVAQYHEIVRLAYLRAEELREQNSSSRKNCKDRLLVEKLDIEDQISKIEKLYNIYGVRLELKQIKAREKANGEAIGKKRLYYKKGTVEYERKIKLKCIVEEFEKNNVEYVKLRTRLSQIEQELDVDANMYDSVLSAIFTRVSDILNELIKKASSVTNNNAINLPKLSFNKGTLNISNTDNNPEICFFNILLDQILQKFSRIQLSEYSVLELLIESARAFKENPMSNSEIGDKIIHYLRAFLLYKNQKTEQLLLPGNDTPVFQSIFSFFVKPLGFEQMERFILLKKFHQKEFAFMLWGCWVGFADMPKTFTGVLFQNEEVTRNVDNLLMNLF